MKRDSRSSPDGPAAADAWVGPAWARPVCILVGIGIALLWVERLDNSLWLDELGTTWVIDLGPGTAVDRATAAQGQTPLYYLLVWALTAAIGDSEIALRLPSLAAMGGATFMVHWLARRVIGHRAAWISAGIFAASSRVVFAAGDARPYAVATLVSLLATSALVAWVKRGGIGSALVYAAISASMVAFHYLFAPVLLGHAVYVGMQVGTGKVRPREVLVASGAFALLLLPTAPQLLRLFRRREELSVALDPILGEAGDVVLPVLLAGLVLLIARMGHRLWNEADPWAPPPDGIVLATAIFVLPPTMLALATVLTTASIPPGRYVIIALPGLALLAAYAVARAIPARLRTGVSISLILGLAAHAAAFTHYTPDDWRGAAAMARSMTQASTPLLLHSGYVEGDNLDRVRTAAPDDFLLAPLSYYEMGGTPFALPFRVSQDAGRFLDHLVVTKLARAPTIVAVVLDTSTTYIEWLRSHLEEVTPSRPCCLR